MLPSWKSKVLCVRKIGENRNLLQIKFLISATTVDQIKLWLEDYENQTMCTYRIRNSVSAKGRTISFKQVLNCHHNCNYVSQCPSRKTKNTNCPSTMTIKLFTTKKHYQRKDPAKIPDKNMPCEILLIPTHNHSTDSPEILKYRPVSNEVTNRLLQLFESGHTPASALNLVRTENLSCKNLLTDRKYFPDYSYCLNLYTRRKKKKNMPCSKSKNVSVTEKDYQKCPSSTEITKDW